MRHITHVHPHFPRSWNMAHQQPGAFPEDYVFVPNRRGRWIFSPNLYGISLGGNAESHPNGFFVDVELTEKNGLLSTGPYSAMCNRARVWVNGMDHLPDPRKPHDFSGEVDKEQLLPSLDCYTSPERREYEEAWMKTFYKN